MDRYSTKRRVLVPLTAWRRRRYSGRCDPFTRAVYEGQDYRPAVRRFFRTSAQQPEILIDVDLPAGAVVLDVGAFVGEWSQRIVERADAGGTADLRIHAFEPEPSSIRRFRGSIGQDPRVELHPFGLGGHDRLEQLSIDGPGSSVFDSPGSTAHYGSTEVEVRDVEAVLSSLAIDRIDLLKINIEGGEFELLDRLHETGRMPSVGTVIVQFHEFAPNAYSARRRNRRQLAETHRCTWSFPWVYERWDPLA